MKVLVTGGAGSIGRTTVAHLAERGFSVRAVGRRPGLTVEGAEYRTCDVTDFDSLAPVMRGMDAVVHLAAVRAPYLAAGQEIFRANCSGTFNVYQAAAQAGIRRLVTASSINAVGRFFGVRDRDPEYFPIDEELPPFTTDAYSFSKQTLEETGRYFWRREGISGACLRFPYVYEPTADHLARIEEGVRRSQEILRELFAMGESKRRERVRAVLAFREEILSRRAMESPGLYGTGGRREAGRSTPADQENLLLMSSRHNFWTYLDGRDAAQSVERSLAGDYRGCHVLFINDSHNNAGVPSRRLADVFYPEVTGWKRELVGTESLVSIDRARELLGFEPQYSVSRFY